MKTTIFISRHSEPFRKLIGNYNAKEKEQMRNEKNILSVNGELKAKQLSEYKELQNVDAIYSSHYVRAMSTAKYIAENNNIKLNVDSRFGERKFGVKNMSKLPKNFFEKQFIDWDYKLLFGESLNQVSKRTNKGLKEIIKNNKGKKIALIAHGTCLTVMLKKWCDLKLNYNTKLVEIFFKDKLIFDGNWKVPELFKLVFEDFNLISIENIEI